MPERDNLSEKIGGLEWAFDKLLAGFQNILSVLPATPQVPAGSGEQGGGAAAPLAGATPGSCVELCEGTIQSIGQQMQTALSINLGNLIGGILQQLPGGDQGGWLGLLGGIWDVLKKADNIAGSVSNTLGGISEIMGGISGILHETTPLGQKTGLLVDLLSQSVFSVGGILEKIRNQEINVGTALAGFATGGFEGLLAKLGMSIGQGGVSINYNPVSMGGAGGGGFGGGGGAPDYFGGFRDQFRDLMGDRGGGYGRTPAWQMGKMPGDFPREPTVGQQAWKAIDTVGAGTAGAWGLMGLPTIMGELTKSLDSIRDIPSHLRGVGTELTRAYQSTRGEDILGHTQRAMLEGARAIPFGGGKWAEDSIKFGMFLTDSVEKLRKFGDHLYDINTKFAEFSSSMAWIQAQQEYREILLSRTRGERLAPSAEGATRAKFELDRRMAIIEDRVQIIKNVLYERIATVIVAIYDKLAEYLPALQEFNGIEVGMDMLQQFGDIAAQKQGGVLKDDRPQRFGGRVP